MGNRVGGLHRRREKPEHAALKVSMKRVKGLEHVNKLPPIVPRRHCLLRLLKQNRIHDYLLLETEFIKRQNAYKSLETQKKEERKLVQQLRGTPTTLAKVHELFNDEQDDLQRCEQKKLLEAAQKRSSLKKCRRHLCGYNVPLPALMNEDGTVKTSHHDMELIAETFYTNLFRSTIPVPGPNIPAGEKPLGILPSEVRVAIESMKRGTTPGPDNITADFLKDGGHNLHVFLADHMTDYLQKQKSLDQWTSRTIILPEKGDRRDLRNCCPIFLLSVLYKLFTKIILSPISRTLDEVQQVEQAGRISKRILLHGPHPNCAQGHRSLSGIPLASSPNLCQL